MSRSLLSHSLLRAGLRLSAVASVLSVRGDIEASEPWQEKKPTDVGPKTIALHYQHLPALTGGYGLGVVPVPAAPEDVSGTPVPRRADGCPIEVRAIIGGDRRSAYALVAPVLAGGHADSSVLKIGKSFSSPLGQVKLLSLNPGSRGPAIKIRFKGAVMRCPLMF